MPIAKNEQILVISEANGPQKIIELDSHFELSFLHPNQCGGQEFALELLEQSFSQFVSLDTSTGQLKLVPSPTPSTITFSVNLRATKSVRSASLKVRFVCWEPFPIFKSDVSKTIILPVDGSKLFQSSESISSNVRIQIAGL